MTTIWPRGNNSRSSNPTATSTTTNTNTTTTASTTTIMRHQYHPQDDDNRNVPNAGAFSSNGSRSDIGSNKMYSSSETLRYRGTRCNGTNSAIPATTTTKLSSSSLSLAPDQSSTWSHSAAMAPSQEKQYNTHHYDNIHIGRGKDDREIHLDLVQHVDEEGEEEEESMDDEQLGFVQDADMLPYDDDDALTAALLLHMAQWERTHAVQATRTATSLSSQQIAKMNRRNTTTSSTATCSSSSSNPPPTTSSTPESSPPCSTSTVPPATHGTGPESSSPSSAREADESFSTSAIALHATGISGGGGGGMSGTGVHREESKRRKILKRVIGGVAMFAVFAGSVYMGHLYICILVAIIEMMLFRELVRVRYSTYFHTIQNAIPFFRTTQWMWFATAIFYCYGDFATDIIHNNQALHYMIAYVQYLPTVSFALYSGTFVLTITTLQRRHIKFQINQLCWTILVLCLTVGQLKYIMHNIFNGLFWYVFPCCLVFMNDIMAYVTGMMLGRKFIRRPFIKFSPNKTWEGFIGGWFFTMITAWYLSRFLAQFAWMTCPTNEFRLMPSQLECQLDPIFQPAHSIYPSQIFEFFPKRLVKVMFPSIVEICTTSRKDTMLVEGEGGAVAATVAVWGDSLVRCATQTAIAATNILDGDESMQEQLLFQQQQQQQQQQHHHFELIVTNYYPIQGHALWLALFASLVAPFGGFAASAIKRAYGIKDFDSLIPGHGGVMDRMDCQLLMALCTWVHYNTFIKLASISVPKLIYMYSLLSETEKQEFLTAIGVVRS